jgi:hypothetical protein
MRNWIFSTQSTNVIVVGIASFFLICGPNGNATQEVRVTSDKPTYFSPTEHSVVIAETLQNSLRFQQLVSQWHMERGATSSIEEMCTRPAYLSIMAMGPAAVPLLLGQLKSEGNDPDHWFVALHYITKGIDPVPNQDKGDMIKMSKSWIEWAEREGDAG